MTEVAAGISVPIKGDASGLSGAVKDAVDALTKLQDKHAVLKRQVDEASTTFGKESAVVALLRREMDETEKKFNALTGAQRKVTTEAKATTDALKAEGEAAKRAGADVDRAATHSARFADVADKMDSKLSVAQRAIGGLGQATGLAQTGVADLVGGFADLFMTMAGGLGTIGLAVAAFALLQKAIAAADEEQAKLDAKWKDEVGPLAKARAEALKNELDLRRSIAAIVEAQGDTKNAGRIMAVAQARGAFEEYGSSKEYIDARDKVNRVLDAANAEVRGAQRAAEAQRVLDQAMGRRSTVPSNDEIRETIATKWRDEVNTAVSAFDAVSGKLGMLERAIGLTAKQYDEQIKLMKIAARDAEWNSLQNEARVLGAQIANPSDADRAGVRERAAIKAKALGLRMPNYADLAAEVDDMRKRLPYLIAQQAAADAERLATQGTVGTYAEAYGPRLGISDRGYALGPNGEYLDLGGNEQAQERLNETGRTDWVPEPLFATMEELQQLADIVSGASGDIVILGEVNKTASQKIKEAWSDAVATLSSTEMVGAIASGQGASMAGQQIGAVGGFAVTSLLLPDAGAASGALGSAIGGALGGLLGTLVDDLITQLGVFTPVLNALGEVVNALQPIFVVVGDAMTVVALAISSAAPLILVLARVVAALALPLVRLFEVSLLAVPLLLAFATGLVMVVDMLTMFVKFIDQNVFIPLSMVVSTVINNLINFINGFTDEIRKLPGFENFGVKLDHIPVAFGSVIDKFIDSQEGLRAALDDNTDTLSSVYNQTLTNVPTGYKTEGVAWGAASVDNRQTIETLIIQAKHYAAEELNEIQRRNMRGTSTSLGNNVVNEDKN